LEAGQKIFGDSVETNKKMVGRSTPLFWIVTDPSHLLFAIEGKDRRVQIEDDLDWKIGF
jgi:hypothetical protein